ncbi:MAG: thiamine-phosphate kinase [Actinomycetes bacterium]
MSSESELIAALSEVFTLSDSKVIIGIGDDGAVIAPSLHKSVLATDMAVEGVHFNRSWSTLKEIGAKITAANLADIYAMGGDPKYLLVSAGLTSDFGILQIKELASGIKSEADLVGASIVGGDISSAEQLVISISVFGEVENPVTRSGAKVGDSVIISGLPGKSAAGLIQLQNGVTDSIFISAHKKPVVNYEIAKKFRTVNSMCDVSDGLLSELNHIASASNVGIELDSKLLAQIPEFKELEAATEEDIWELVLSGGEDHVFVATTSENIPEGVFIIGKVVPGKGVKISGVSQLPTTGFRHF